MDEGRGEIELYNQWFSIADVDKDGVLSGGEAVQFFMRSGLPRSPTLFKIWQYVAGDRASLTRQEFYTAMKLVSVAQRSGGVLNEHDAGRVVNGLGGAVVPPRMEGLDVGQTVREQDVMMHGQQQRQGVQQQPAHFAGTMKSVTYPPLSNDKAAVYQTAFDQLDGDGDGFVQGSHCFETFMQSGLSKNDLKLIWDVVAGNEGALNRHQFIQCLYLIDCAKLNYPIPKELPPGQFPPVQGNGYGVAQLMNKSQGDIYSNTLEVPSMPQKASYVPISISQTQYQSVIPPKPSDDQLSGLTAVEQAQLQAEREVAERRENEIRRLEQERAAAAAKREFYTQSLADLRMAQSKLSRTLVEAEQREEMEKRECAEMEAQYDAAYAKFSEEHARIGPMLEKLEEAQANKAALIAKRGALEAAIGQLEDYDPDWENREKGECETLKKEISELMARYDALEKSTEAIATRRKDLLGVVDCLQIKCEQGETQVTLLEEEMRDAESRLANSGDAVVDLLKRIAPLYNNLIKMAKDALVPLPPEALASIAKPAPAPFRYDPHKFGAYTGDWHAFEDADYSVSAALPQDNRLETLLSPSLRQVEETVEKGEVNCVDEEMEDSECATREDKVSEEEKEGQDIVTHENPMYIEEKTNDDNEVTSVPIEEPKKEAAEASIEAAEASIEAAETKKEQAEEKEDGAIQHEAEKVLVDLIQADDLPTS